MSHSETNSGHDSEEFKRLADNIPNLAWMATPDGAIYWYNKRWYEYTGTTPEQMKGWGWQSVHHPMELDSVLEKWKEAILKAQTFEMTFPLKAKNGSFRHFLTRVIPVKDEDGILTHWFGSNTDITDKIIAEKALKDSEQRFAAAVRAVNGIIWTNSPEGKMTGIQSGWGILTGQSFEEYQAYGWAKAVHPDDADNTIKAWEFALNNRITFEFEHRVRKASGEYGHFDIRAIPVIDSAGNVKEWVGVHTDITEKKQHEKTLSESEEKFRLLADSLPQKIWTTDEHGAINYLNASFLFYTNAEKYTGDKDWLACLHPDEKEGYQAAWIRAVNECNEFTFDHRFRDANNNYRWHQTQAAPQRDNKGRIRMWVGTTTDNHDQKLFMNKLEAEVKARTSEINKKNAELLNINEELSSFTHIASHDLKEPLRKIKIFSGQIMAEEKEQLPESVKEKMLRIQKAVERMQLLIDDLLDFSQTDHTIFEESETDLIEIINEVSDEFREDIKNFSVKVNLTTTCTFPAIKFQMLQVFQNLMSNALKFRKKNEPPVININCHKASSSELPSVLKETGMNYACIQFSDTGIGFEPEYSNKIFDMFQRLHGQHEYPGTGLGLSIVRKIIVNHGGLINASGTSGQGVTFDIYLPTK